MSELSTITRHAVTVLAGQLAVMAFGVQTGGFDINNGIAAHQGASALQFEFRCDESALPPKVDVLAARVWL